MISRVVGSTTSNSALANRDTYNTPPEGTTSRRSGASRTARWMSPSSETSTRGPSAHATTSGPAGDRVTPRGSSHTWVRHVTFAAWRSTRTSSPVPRSVTHTSVCSTWTRNGLAFGPRSIATESLPTMRSRRSPGGSAATRPASAGTGSRVPPYTGTDVMGSATPGGATTCSNTGTTTPTSEGEQPDNTSSGPNMGHPGVEGSRAPTMPEKTTPRQQDADGACWASVHRRAVQAEE